MRGIKISDHALKRIFERIGRESCINYINCAYLQGKEPSDEFLANKVLNTELWSTFNTYRIYRSHLFVFKKDHKKIVLITVI